VIILHVVTHYYPVLGGLEKAVQKLAEEQTKLNHEVHVLTSTYGAETRSEEETLNNVSIHRVRAWRLHYPDLTIPKEVPKMLLKRADVIHVHSQNSMFNLKIIEAVKPYSTRVAMHFMAIDAINDHPNFLIRILGSFYVRCALKKALKLADVKMCRSKRDVEILKKRYGVERVYLVPDGIDKEIIIKPNMAQFFREKYKVYDDIILYVGRLHRLKGIKILLKSASAIVKEHRDVTFIFIGPGNKMPYISFAKKLGILKNVMFLGYVSEEDKIGALDSSIALILPSICNYVEVYPMVISEAWARKKPVIASSVGGVPYRIRHLKNGILVQPKDYRMLAYAITMLLEDKNLARKLGEEGFKEIRNYTWDKIALLVEKVYIS